VLLVGFMVAEQMNLSDKVRTSPLSVNYTVSEEAQDLFSREQLQMQAEIIVKTIKQELSQCGSLSVNTYQKELLAFYHDNHPETLWMIVRLILLIKNYQLLELINDDPHLETTFDQ
jgi:hypothetical protein